MPRPPPHQCALPRARTLQFGQLSVHTEEAVRGRSHLHPGSGPIPHCVLLPIPSLLLLAQPRDNSSRRPRLQNSAQHALRTHRTKTWPSSAPLPDPGMHRGAGRAFQLGRKMAAPGAGPQVLVQYLVLRKDLSQTPFSWPAGALVAQACHAATAALHIHRDHPHTVAYLQELGRMRKVVLEVSQRTGVGREDVETGSGCGRGSWVPTSWHGRGVCRERF